MRTRYCRTRSFDVTRPCSIADRMSRMDASTTENGWRAAAAVFFVCAGLSPREGGPAVIHREWDSEAIDIAPVATATTIMTLFMAGDYSRPEPSTRRSPPPSHPIATG